MTYKTEAQGTASHALTHESGGADEIDITGVTGTSKSGTYTGNNSANRAIPHGGSSVPKFVVFERAGASSLGYVKLLVAGYIDITHSTVRIRYAVTSWDATNFYVGNSAEYTNSANSTGTVHTWVAVF